MEKSFEEAVSFALSALRKSMLVLTRCQKEALKSIISCKDTFVSLLPSHWTWEVHHIRVLAALLRLLWRNVRHYLLCW